MPTFVHDGIEFSYFDLGRGLPFVFLHGLGNDISQPRRLLPQHDGVRLLSFDFRSHGGSWPVGEFAKLSISQFAQDLDAFLRHVGLDSAVVGGTSLGGAVALHFALRYPARVRGLVLSRPAWLNTPRPQNLFVLEVVAGLLRECGASEGMAALSKNEAFREIECESKAAARSVMRLFEDPHAETRIDRFELLPRSLPFADFGELAGVSVPTLIIGNDRDPIHPRAMSEVLAASIPRSELCIVTSQAVDGNAHRVEVQQAILKFLNRLSSSVWRAP